jgi:type I restriction enzyme S subunit
MNFTPNEQAKYQLKPGDVLVSEGAGSLAAVGASARWQGELPGVVCFQNTLLRLRALTGEFEPGFLYFWARWAFESGAFAERASGTNIFHIGATRAKVMPAPLPPIDEQRVQTELLESIEDAETAAVSHVESLRACSASLLARLLEDGAAPADGIEARAA